MKISDLDGFFEKIGRGIIRHRIMILIILAAFTVLSLAGISKLEISDNEEAWFSGSAEAMTLQKSYKEKFGNPDGIYFLFEADDVFDHDVLKAMYDLCDKIETNVPYVKNFDGIVKSEVCIGNEEGIIVKSPFEDGIPDDAKLQEIKKLMLSKDSYVNTIFTRDCKQAILAVSFYDFDGGDDELCTDLSDKAVTVLSDPEFKSDKFKIYPAGEYYTYKPMSDAIMDNLYLSVLLGFIVMVLCLVLLVRNIRCIIFTIISTILGILVVFGISGWFGIVGNMSLLTIPVLLGMALSVGYSIHLVNGFKMNFRKTGIRREAVITTFADSFWPLFFTVITTFASLISYLFAETKPVKWLGGVSSMIVLAVFLYVIILIPVVMSFGKDRDSTSEKVEELTKADLAIGKFGTKIVDSRKLIIAVSAVLTVVMIFFITKIKVNQTDKEVYGEKLQIIRDQYHLMDSQLGSAYSYEVVLNFEDEDAVKTYDVLSRLEEFQNRIGTLGAVKRTEGKPQTASILSILKEMNKTLNEDKKEYFCIPEDDMMISQVLFMYEISGGKDLFDWVDDTYQTTHISVNISTEDSKTNLKDFAQIRKWGSELFPEAKLSLTGIFISYTESNSLLVVSALKSFGFSFIIILLMIAVAFSGIRIGLIGMIPNIAPVIVAGGIMGLLHFSLDMYTMTVLPMILGIAVDDTIHFMNHVKMYYEKGFAYRDAIIQTFKEIGKSMIMTTVILCAMFLMYIISPIQAIFRVGLLAFIGLAFALIADYTLTPVIIYLTKPWGKENK